MGITNMPGKQVTQENNINIKKYSKAKNHK